MKMRYMYKLGLNTGKYKKKYRHISMCLILCFSFCLKTNAENASSPEWDDYKSWTNGENSTFSTSFLENNLTVNLGESNNPFENKSSEEETILKSDFGGDYNNLREIPVPDGWVSLVLFILLYVYQKIYHQEKTNKTHNIN